MTSTSQARPQKRRRFLTPAQKHAIAFEWPAATPDRRRAILAQYDISQSAPYAYIQQGFGANSAAQPLAHSEATDDDRLLAVLCEAQRKRVITGSQADEILSLWTGGG